MTPTFFDYAVIVAATAGTLVYLFLMILIVGYRRRRTFERVLFFLALAAFLVYGGILLGVNAKLFYGRVPSFAEDFVLALIVPGAFFLPALLLHAQAEHMDLSESRPFNWSLRPFAMAVYATPLLFAAFVFVLHRFDPPTPQLLEGWFIYEEPSAFEDALGWAVLGVALLAFIFSTWVQFRLANAMSRAGNATLGRFHRAFAVSFTLLGLAVLTLSLDLNKGLPVLLAGSLPGVLLIVGTVRFRVLEIGNQKNLVYGVTAGFLAILYLALVRRISGWAEAYFPPEATSAILIFVLIGFFEPLQRFANRVLRRNVEQQLEQLQRMTNELQREAHEGDLPRLTAFAERRIREEFGLDTVKLKLGPEPSVVETPEGGRLRVGAKAPTLEKSKDESLARKQGTKITLGDEAMDRPEMDRPAWAGQPVRLRLGKAGAEIGAMVAIPIGSSISGETHAALEFLAEQLPGIIELCRAIDQKLQLERELAERERLALVGQMTASISHNLKNPLGSMKTVLEVQLENPGLEESVRRDLQMVLSELGRLNGKLNALLRYARPAVRGGEASIQIEIARVAKEVTELMDHEAKRQGVTVELHESAKCGCIRGNEEALNDILSNLIVNAIEAVSAGGRVDVRLGGDEREVEVVVADDGADISAEQQARLFQPFFTTKASGTGLGLAIVRRRATELGGTVSCQSPIADGRGAEFIVRLPRMKC